MGQDNSTPQPGDLIEIKWFRYQHWVLYVGDGYVIHVTDQRNPSSSGSSGSACNTRATVKKELLTQVATNDNWSVNNKYDCHHDPFPVEEIIQRAERWVGREVPYDLVNNNCEHFVTMLRYGVGLSEQVESAFVGVAALAIGFVLFAAAALTMLARPRR